MERHYGKGLTGMFHPETGKFDMKRVGWAQHGRRLGESLSIEIAGINFDATTTFAMILGAASGSQWDGLAQGKAEELAGAGPQLSNCFAATYAELEQVDQIVYDWENIISVPGEFKGLDVFVNDPLKIFADSTVLYEVCDGGTVVNQFKLMTSLDWSSLADNVVRESLVLALELPESLDLMNTIEQAGTCAVNAATDAAGSATEIGDGLLEDATAAGETAVDAGTAAVDAGTDAATDAASGTATDGTATGDDWWNFNTDVAADVTSGATDAIADATDSLEGLEGAAEGAVDAALECVDLIDQFAIGKVGGKFVANLFNNSVKPLN